MSYARVNLDPIVEPISSREVAASPTHLLSNSDLEIEFAGVDESLRSNLLKAATIQLGQYVNYGLERVQIFARYTRWGRQMELPLPRPALAYSAELVSSIELVDASDPDNPVMLNTPHSLDIAPPPMRIVFSEGLPTLNLDTIRVKAPAEIRFIYSPLLMRDSRTLSLKNALRLLLKTLIDQNDDPLAPEYPWREAAGPMRRIAI